MGRHHVCHAPFHTHADTDECAMGMDNCQHTCFNTDGSFLCACFAGSTLAADGMTCTGKTNVFTLSQPGLIYSFSSWFIYSG